MAFTLDENDGNPALQVADLARQLGKPEPAPGALHHTLEIKGGFLRFERHGEFYRLSITVPGKRADSDCLKLLPPGWLATLPGKRLVSAQTDVVDLPGKATDEAALARYFGHEDIAGSQVNQGKAAAWTDFRIGADGHTRFLIHNRGLSPFRLGRLARRLHEIETYRMMALLALPLARDLQRELAPLEKTLADIVDRMASVQDPAEDANLLADLTAISRQVETLSNRSSYRFAASRAYGTLVAKRVAELHEERNSDYPRIGVFLDRRFSPALTTCEAVAQRLQDLAQRCERASNLLRTRVDIALENQNQQLLRSMESRARQQLMLQETVEGLSVVAISYYLIGIVTKFLSGSTEFLFGKAVKELEWLVIPVVVLAVWAGLRQLKKRLKERA
jgi:uncharacterized membrane-anchored protein